VLVLTAELRLTMRLECC